jgi:uncharacterized MAPEG superfamily protein
MLAGERQIGEATARKGSAKRAGLLRQERQNRSVAMNVPVLVLLGFAAWTLLTLFGTVGIYRWSLILTGHSSIAEWRADLPQGSDWYRRAMRAHMNCVENLPIYTAIVVAMLASGVQSSVVDHLALTMLAARIGQTLTHVALPPTNVTSSLRFVFFLMQAVCMTAMGVLIAVRSSP